jgi:DDE superfamily endonuclease/helix-turn-helix, Psq domain
MLLACVVNFWPFPFYLQPKPQRLKRTNRTYSHDALTQAYKAVVEDNMPVRTAVKLFSVPRTTLRDRLSGRVHPDTVTTGKPPLFSMFEEARLVSHIKTMAGYGYGYTRQECVNLAMDLAVQLGKRGRQEQLSLKWMRGLLKRWPELRVLKPRGLEYSRARMASELTVSTYFQNLQLCLEEHSLADKPHLIFNIDEKGITTEHKPPSIIGSASHCPPAVTSGRGKTVTLLGCISASGTSLPPFFVFPGKRMNERLLEGKSPGADGTVSETGWSNHAIFRHYIQNHFVKFIPGRGNQKVLLILDGHKSHVSVGLCEWARDNGIILFYLPPHTSHILQPLDVSCYGPFERIFNNECHKLMRQTQTILTVYNVCEVACRVYTKALSSENAQSAFRRTGIFPLNKNAIPSESLLPAEVYQSDPLSDDSQATVEGGITEAAACCDSTDDPFTVLDSKESQLKKVKREKERKPRNTMSKIVAGKEVTPLVLSKMKIHESMGKKSKKEQHEEIQCNEKKKKQKSVTLENSMQPGPSHINLVCDTPSISSDSDSEDEQSLCCVCKKFTPAELRNSVSVVFTKWAQCDGFRNGLPCLHWVHLIYCTPVRVIRKGDTFLCPHCKEE